MVVCWVHWVCWVCRIHQSLITGHSSVSALVIILQAHDILLAKDFAPLNLDYHQRIGTRVLQSMHRTNRDGRRLKGWQLYDLVVDDNPGSSRDKNPVLAPVTVELEAQAMAGPDLNGFYLIPHALGQDGPPTPGTLCGITLVRGLMPSLSNTFVRHDCS